MTSAEVRQSFLDFFESKQHEIVPSSSLLPSAPNLLFTNAGMNQFVPYFLGERPAPYSRAADTQKCIRAGGKHNDLEDVGFDTYHHTFFEMLGNWSFGDYFKKEAIEWAWELLTGVWGFPKERLYATVYKPGEGDPAEFDQEAYDIWKALFEQEGMDPSVHIVMGNKADNFWMMGDTGPCGPCSEIHIDLTEKGDTKGSLVNADNGRCIEIWNLVFIQFNAEPNGSFKPLSAKHVDTGMGFERVAGIMASTKGFTDFSAEPSNYDSDVFGDIFAALETLSGHEYKGTIPKGRANLSETELKDCAFRILADHARALCCSITDTILPGADGRNYVLRRILRRAVLWAGRAGLPPGAFTKLVDPVVDKLGQVFPELETRRDMLRKVIASEEATFEETITRGLQLIDKIIDGPEGTVSGEDAFTLYDTYGFPLDLTQLVTRERGWTIDEKGFQEHLEKARARSRAGQKKSVITVQEDAGDRQGGVFVGYEAGQLSEHEATITDVVEGDKIYLVFDETPFYAEMGGQIGDNGVVAVGDKTFFVRDTIKDDLGRFLHEIDAVEPQALKGAKAKLTVNTERRAGIQRHHSATHVLNYALREVLGDQVIQQGSLVAPDHLRFDFSHFEGLTPEIIDEIEHVANEHILMNSPVAWYEVPFNEKPENCIATFGEKYGEIVRVVDIGGWSVELCGGTHVRASGEIGLLKVTHEGAIAAGTRRIMAVAGESALDYTNRHVRMVSELGHKLSCKPDELGKRIEALLEQRGELEKELKKLRQKSAGEQVETLAKQAREVNGLRVVGAKAQTGNPNEMRGLAVQIAKKMGPSVVALGGDFGGKATVLALCSPEAVEAGHKAGDIIRELTGQLGGKGGGKPDFAMGGGKDVAKLDEVLRNFQSQFGS